MSTTTVNLGMLPNNRGSYTSETWPQNITIYKDNIVEFNNSAYIYNPASFDIANPAASATSNPPYDAATPTVLNTGWYVFASGNNTFTTGEKVDNVGIDTEPTAGSNNLVKSGGVAEIIGISINPFEQIQHQVGATTQSSTGNRYSLLFNVRPGDIIKVKSTWEIGVFARIWDNRYNALIGNATGALQGSGSYTTSEIYYISEYNGVLRIGTKKNDNSIFTETDINNFLSNLEYEIYSKDSINGKIKKLQEESDEVPNSIPFCAVLCGKDSFFNANNTTFKVEIPAFTCFIKDSAVNINSMELDYLWHVDSSTHRIVYALVLTDDLSSVEMIEWVNITEKHHVIATISRTNGYIQNDAVINFGGCFGNPQDKGLWRIDGKTYVGNTKEQLDAISNLSWLSIISGGYINANNATQKFEINLSMKIVDISGEHIIPVQEVSYSWGEDNRVWYALVVSDDYTTVTMIPHADLTSSSKILAVLIRDSIYTHNFTKFYGSAGTVLFKIDGVNQDTKIEDIKDEIEDLWEEIPIGSFGNKTSAPGQGAGILVDSDYRVTSLSVMTVPYNNATIKLTLPENYKWNCISGDTQSLNTDSGWIAANAEYTIPNHHIWFRMMIANKDNPNTTPIYASDIINFVNQGKIKFLYKKSGDSDVVLRNRNAEIAAQAACRKFATNLTTQESLAWFSHGSDFHGDVVRFTNFIRYSKYLGVDAALATGDLCSFSADSGPFYQKDVITKYPVKLLTIVGNHDSKQSTMVQKFTNNIEPYIEQGGYLLSENTPTTKSYYYVDFSVKKMRVIGLNYYNLDNQSYSDAVRLGQDQIDWLISTLLSTPQDYGVIIMLHGQEKWITTATSGYDKFFQSEQISYPIVSVLGNGIVSKIVDAFISGTTINTSFTEVLDDGTSSETISVVGDFSSKATGVEFICFVAGHSHRDLIGYVPDTTNPQLMLDIVCSVGPYSFSGNALSNECDLPRGGVGVCQDAFNIYGIDRVKKVVRVVRIGANMTKDLIPRDYMTIPYLVN